MNISNYVFVCSVHFVKCDVTLRYDWMKMWDEAEHALGGKIEILCNNAGVPPRVCCFLKLLFKVKM